MYRFFLVLFFSLIFCFNSFSQKENNQPKIGLALSGGGAKGLAHIGVLKVLEEVGIKIDYISGTSMGGIVGGLYSIGYTAKEIEEIVQSMNWEEVLMDKVSRRSISIEEKEEEAKYIAEFPIIKGKVQLPRGLVTGQNFSNLLAHLTYPVHHINDFSKFPIPFCCIATDIATGEAVVLNKGYLPEAIRASMAIPSVFTPIEIDGKLLVDGLLIRNFPVSDVIKMGADIVIGVDVGATLYKKEELNSLMEIMDQATSFRGATATKEQQALCDFLISPNMTNFKVSDFELADSLIAEGEKAARKILPELKLLAKSMNQNFPQKKIRKIPLVSLHTIYINKIKIKGLKKVSKNIIEGKLQLKDSTWITHEQLEKGIDQIYGTQFFDRVTYQILPEKNGNTLLIKVEEHTHNVFKFGGHYDNHFQASLLLNLSFRNILGNGSKLFLSSKLGQYSALRATYLIHTAWKPGIGFGTDLWYNNFEVSAYDEKGEVDASFDFVHLSATAFLQTIFSNDFAIGSGVQAEYFSLDPKIFQTDYQNLDIAFFSHYAYMKRDTYNWGVFPTKGAKMYLEGRFYFKNMNLDTSYNWDESHWKFMFSYDRFFPLHPKLTLETGIYAGINIGKNIHYVSQFYLGSQNSLEKNMIPFTGIRYMSKTGKNVLSLRVGLRIEPWKDKYITFRSNIAKTSDFFETIFEPNDIIVGGGISFGINTIVGPMEFTLGTGNTTSKLTSFLNIGYSF